MKDFTDDELLNGILKHDRKALNYIYNKYFPQVIQGIRELGGNESDAFDVFQEVIVIIYQKLKIERMNVNYQLNTYLVNACRKAWQKSLQRSSIQTVALPDTDVILPEENAFWDAYQKNLENKIYQRHFNELSFMCKKVLQFLFQKFSVEESAKLLGVNEIRIKNLRASCSEKLIQRIKNDPEYKDMMYGNK